MSAAQAAAQDAGPYDAYYQGGPTGPVYGDPTGGYGGNGYQAPLPMNAQPVGFDMAAYGPMPYGPMPADGGYGGEPPGMLTGVNVAVPTFYARVDWLFWKPHRAGKPVTLSTNDGGNFPNLGYAVGSTSDLKPDFESGWRAELGYTLGPGLTVSGVYYNQDDWSDSLWLSSGTTPGRLNVPFAPNLNEFLKVDDFYQNQSQWFIYDTELRSAELNLATNTAWGSVRHAPLIGFRWLRVGEGLFLRTYDDAGATPLDGLGEYGEVIKNNLYGCQIGDSIFWQKTERLAFEGGFKVGIYGNQMKMDKYVLNNGVGTFGGVTSTRAAFAGEFNLGTTFNITQACLVRVGYTGLLVHQLALAPDNFDTLTNLTRSIRDVNGTRFYHGLNVGCEYRY